MARSLSLRGQGFLRDLQNSNDVRKKRYIIGGTMLVMFVVVALWVFFMYVFGTPTEPQAAPDFSFVQGIRGLGEVVVERFMSGLGKIGGMMPGTKDYVVSPQ